MTDGRDWISPRDVVARHVFEHPGVHQRRLARELGLASATVHHHVRLLLASGRVVAQRDGRYVRYFAPAASVQARELGSLAAREKPSRILRALLAAEPADVQELARATGLRSATVGANLMRLARAGAVVRERIDRRYVYRLDEASRAFFSGLAAAPGREASPEGAPT
ncbi:MAG: hypothetical protein QOE90_2152 [Thermoplasmata archaeon]|jgi:predicted transcriptional regulator|nr:hypothetical protein [Thermoplasmata archaeon]